MFRVLAENKRVKERRRLAGYPTRAVPELVATPAGQVYTWDITFLADLLGDATADPGCELDQTITQPQGAGRFHRGR